MLTLSSRQIAQIVGYDAAVNDARIEGISSDSRTCLPHDLFIAVRGERFDGHTYVKQVIEAGCPLVIVDHLIADVDLQKQIVVSDTLDAWGKIGAYIRRQFKGIVIGLTGSSGKTTVKEEIGFLLSKFGKVYVTAGNHNNFVGVPETLCGLDMSADFAVVEMGMSAKGEIARLVSYVQPDIAIVTNVYQMHMEFFETYEQIAEAKAEIFSGLKPGGIAVINQDTDFAALLEKRALEHGAMVQKFGLKTHPELPFASDALPTHQLYNAWCALRVVEALGLDVKKAATAVKDFKPLDGRGREHRLRLPQGRGYYTLIDDSYSGQPEAMKIAIDVLSRKKTSGRKIVILGKMAELGSVSKEKHIEIGQKVAAGDIDIAIGVCPEMKDMLSQLPDRMEKHYFENKDPVADFLLNQLLQNDDVVLIKGARYSSKMYQVAAELIKKGS